MRNHPKVTSINNVTPIRFGVVVEHPAPRILQPRSYEEETNLCIRYENNLCRFCDKSRIPQSPWCPEHFPWATMSARTDGV